MAKALPPTGISQKASLPQTSPFRKSRSIPRDSRRHVQSTDAVAPIDVPETTNLKAAGTSPTSCRKSGQKGSPANALSAPRKKPSGTGVQTTSRTRKVSPAGAKDLTAPILTSQLASTTRTESASRSASRSQRRAAISKSKTTSSHDDASHPPSAPPLTSPPIPMVSSPTTQVLSVTTVPARNTKNTRTGSPSPKQGTDANGKTTKGKTTGKTTGKITGKTTRTKTTTAPVSASQTDASHLFSAERQSLNIYRHAMHLFQQQDYAGARDTLELLLSMPSLDPEITSRVKVFLKICSQRTNAVTNGDSPPLPSHPAPFRRQTRK